MDWNRFGFDYRLRLANLRPQLIQIEAYKQAALNLVLPPDWSEQLDRLNRVRTAHGTTALEGNPLSEAEVERQIDLLPEVETQIGYLSKEQMQIRNAAIAQDWVKRRFKPDAAPIGFDDILRMHALITTQSDDTNNVPGQLRTYSVVVGTEALGGVHQGAPPSDLRRLMEEFVAFVNSRQLREGEHPVVRALLAHFFLVTIHPFGDGNGRVSRLVEAGLLFEGGYNVLGFYGLSNYFYRNADEYRRLLRDSRRRQPFDLESFVAFGVGGFAAELRGINNFIKTKLNRVIYRNMLARAANQREGRRRRVLNGREHGLLDFLLRETEPVDPFSPEPSRQVEYSELLQAPYVKAAYKSVTARTFFRELIRLGERGFIEFERRKDDLLLSIDFSAIGRY